MRGSADARPLVAHVMYGSDAGDLHGSSRRYQWACRIHGPFVTYCIALTRGLEHYLTSRVGMAKTKVLLTKNDVDAHRFQPVGTYRLILGCPFTDTSCWLAGALGRVQAAEVQAALASAFYRSMDIAPRAKQRLRLLMTGGWPKGPGKPGLQLPAIERGGHDAAVSRTLKALTEYRLTKRHEPKACAA